MRAGCLRPSAPGWWLVILEGRAGWEATASVLAWPILQTAPKGDGHPVMVIPGIGADDHTTLILRHYLTDRGYAVTGWGQGINRGDGAGVREALVQRSVELEAASGRTVSLVGWSMGGVFARMLAHQHTRSVRRVVTLGTPFAGDEQGTNAGWAYRLLNGWSPAGLKRSTLGCAATAAARVPTTSIYSRTDGVVSWHNSVAPQHDTLSENIEVHASHLGIGAHPCSRVRRCGQAGESDLIAQPAQTFACGKHAGRETPLNTDAAGPRGLPGSTAAPRCPLPTPNCARLADGHASTRRPGPSRPAR